MDQHGWLRPRAVGTTLAAAWLVVLCAAGPAAAQQPVAPGTASGASVTKTGWWWRANETPSEQAPVAPPAVSPPNVPEGSLPVSAVLGEPEKVTAIEFALEAQPGATVSSFGLSLREAAAPGSNVGHETAKVTACPVTEAFWSDGAAASWQAQPTYDCAMASAAGTRGTDGVWSFDLTSMATLWLAADSTMSPSIVLVEQVEPPGSFQVAFDGPDGIGVALAATPGAAPGGGDGESGLPGGDAGGVPSDGLGSSGSVPGDGGAVPGTGEVPSAAPPPVAADDDADRTEAVRAADTRPTLFDNIPAAALSLIPIGLLAAYLVMLALGPNGEPVVQTARRGVSRALDLRRARKGT